MTRPVGARATGQEMGKVIAVAGKGGSGKTTLAALLVRTLRERGLGPVLAVDADPNANLGEALGVEVRQTLGAAVEDLRGERAAAPAGMSKDALLEMRFASLVDERTGFDLLTMGRGEGPGCYCAVNNPLRALVERLSRSYRFVVSDNEAGLEHLSRRTQRSIDALVLASDFSVRGLRAARRVADLVVELGLAVGASLLVVGRAPVEPARREEDLRELLRHAGGPALELGGVLPVDEAIARADLRGQSLLDLDPAAPSVEAARSVLDAVLVRIGSRPDAPSGSARRTS